MSDLSSLSSLSDDEEAPRIRIIRDRNNPFEMYDDVDFKLRFRFRKAVVMQLLHEFGNHIEPATHRNKSIDALRQLLITLRFYATGSFQSCIGDHINIHQSSVSRIVHKVTHHIALKANEIIKMPTEREITRICQAFHQIAGMPRVIGAIDCSHIKISSPGGELAETFRNRKGYFSINVQVVCDPQLKIRHIIARWPGSVHDSTIFNDCPLIVELQRNQYGRGNFLLGDSGYACKPYLLTPVLNPDTPAERRYNRAHNSTRNTVERCFGVWKRRFPCLSVGLRNATNRSLSIIVACAVLHNMAIAAANNDAEEFNDLQIEANVEPLQHDNENMAVRQAIIQTVFT